MVRVLALSGMWGDVAGWVVGTRTGRRPARFVFKPKPELPFRPVGPSVGEVVRSTPLRAPGLVLAAHGVGWRALRVLPRLVFWPHCVY
jgi:hypothetical protein